MIVVQCDDDVITMTCHLYQCKYAHDDHHRNDHDHHTRATCIWQHWCMHYGNLTGANILYVDICIPYIVGIIDMVIYCIAYHCDHQQTHV